VQTFVDAAEMVKEKNIKNDEGYFIKGITTFDLKIKK
jgi:hypothetical protein